MVEKNPIVHKHNQIDKKTACFAQKIIWEEHSSKQLFFCKHRGNSRYPGPLCIPLKVGKNLQNALQFSFLTSIFGGISPKVSTTSGGWCVLDPPSPTSLFFGGGNHMVSTQNTKSQKIPLLFFRRTAFFVLAAHSWF